ncbi:MAG TPA: hypothetical protein VMX54_04520 [Vicinamibacteria bacterium]|nr:hypothetical protein [Vicinamibacteria bacterium]
MSAGEVLAVAEVVDPRARPRDGKGKFLRGNPNARRARSLRGNMNRVRFPWRVYWRRRAIAHADRWALRLVEDYIPQLVADKGGEQEITAAERRLAELAAAARVCWALALTRHTDATARIEAAKFMQVERGCLKDLGTVRRPKALDLSGYVEGRSRAEDSTSSARPEQP